MLVSGPLYRYPTIITKNKAVRLAWQEWLAKLCTMVNFHQLCKLMAHTWLFSELEDILASDEKEMALCGLQALTAITKQGQELITPEGGSLVTAQIERQSGILHQV